MVLHENIFKLRRRENLSQEELAEKLGVTRQAVSKWESAQSAPDIDKLLALCKIFNVSADELLTEPNLKEKIPSSLITKTEPADKAVSYGTINALFWGLLFLAGFILFMFLLFSSGGSLFDSGLYLFSLFMMAIPFIFFLFRSILALSFSSKKRKNK